MKSNVKSIVRVAIFAALYAVLTLAISPISFGAIQCRLAIIMSFFCVGNRQNSLGYILGTFIANIFSPLGIIDMAVGTLVSTIVATTAYKTKSEIAVFAANVIAVPLLVGAEISCVYSIPFLTNALYIAIGTAISCIAGFAAAKIVKHNKKVYGIIMGEENGNADKKNQKRL